MDGDSGLHLAIPRPRQKTRCRCRTGAEWDRRQVQVRGGCATRSRIFRTLGLPLDSRLSGGNGRVERLSNGLTDVAVRPGAGRPRTTFLRGQVFTRHFCRGTVVTLRQTVTLSVVRQRGGRHAV